MRRGVGGVSAGWINLPAEMDERNLEWARDFRCEVNWLSVEDAARLGSMISPDEVCEGYRRVEDRVPWPRQIRLIGGM